MMENKRCFRFCVALASVLALLTALTLAACGEKESSPESGGVQSSEWAADGTIAAGEYTGKATYGNYEIHWKSNEEHIFIGIRARTNGWVAVGINPTSQMKDADIVLGYVKDGMIEVSDQFSAGNYGPHPPDSELGGSEDIIESGGREEGGYTTIEFKRSLKTSDSYDNEIVRGANRIIWAYGTGDSPEQRHASRGTGEIVID